MNVLITGGYMISPKQVLNWAASMLVYRDAGLAADLT
jgi:hypothetical protein